MLGAGLDKNMLGPALDKKQCLDLRKTKSYARRGVR